MIEKFSQRRQNVTVEETRCISLANGSVSIAWLEGSRKTLADSSEVVMKSIKIKQTLHYSVPLSEFGSSLPFKFFSSELSCSFFSFFYQVWSLL